MSTKRIAPFMLIFVVLTLLFVFPPTLTTIAQRPTPDAASTGGNGAETSQAGVMATVAGGPGFYSRNAMGFSPWPNNSVPISWDGIRLVNPDSITFHAYESPVDLPHGATITQFSAWIVDNDPATDRNMWAVLAEMNMDGTGIQQIARVDSSGAQPSVRVLTDTTIIHPVIDLQNKAYWVEIYMPPSSDVAFISFRIDYTYDAFAPLISR